MRIRTYQKLADRTVNKDLSSAQKESHALHGMASEVGEIHALYQKTYQGHPLDKEHLKSELGDLMWFIAEMCTANNWTLEEICIRNITKLEKRFPQGFSAEESLNRAEDDI